MPRHICPPVIACWGYSLVGRASHLHCEGRRFESGYLHQTKTLADRHCGGRRFDPCRVHHKKSTIVDFLWWCLLDEVRTFFENTDVQYWCERPARRVARFLSCFFKMQFARRAQEGVWGENGRAGFGAGGFNYCLSLYLPSSFVGFYHYETALLYWKV